MHDVDDLDLDPRRAAIRDNLRESAKRQQMLARGMLDPQKLGDEASKNDPSLNAARDNSDRRAAAAAAAVGVTSEVYNAVAELQDKFVDFSTQVAAEMRRSADERVGLIKRIEKLEAAAKPRKTAATRTPSDPPEDV